MEKLPDNAPEKTSLATLELGEELARWIRYDVAGEQVEVLSEEEWHWSPEERQNASLLYWLRERCARDRLNPNQVRVLLADGSIRLRSVFPKEGEPGSDPDSPPAPHMKPEVTAPDRLKITVGLLNEAGIRTHQISLKEHALFEALCRGSAAAETGRRAALFSLEPGILTVTVAQRNAMLSAHRVPVDTGDCDLTSLSTRKALLQEVRTILDYEKALLKHPVDTIYFAADEPDVEVFCEWLSQALEIPIQPWVTYDLSCIGIKTHYEGAALDELKASLDEVFKPADPWTNVTSQIKKSVRALVFGGLILAVYVAVLVWSLLHS
ncbi:MAG: hypothetical protein HYY14_00635 [Candidatus Omnitrophica bacterium]|nr:hypothetical protein [Candidatus Omnitrophota bacterium]